MAKILMIAMSLRKESFNKKLIENMHGLLLQEHTNHQVELLSLNDFPMGMYNGDDETEKGVPDSIKILAKKISETDAIIISTPEYNGGMPGVFKNTVDWVSRISPMPWADKKILLIGASPGALGAIRSLWHSRVPLEAIGGFVFPDMFGLPHANEAFDENRKLKDEKTTGRLKTLLVKFLKQLKE